MAKTEKRGVAMFIYRWRRLFLVTFSHLIVLVMCFATGAEFHFIGGHTVPEPTMFSIKNPFLLLWSKLHVTTSPKQITLSTQGLQKNA